jgi:hypothetical protein
MWAAAAAVVASSVMKGMAEMRQGQAMKAMYEAQANQAVLAGNQQALRYKQEGNKALEALLRANATATARAGAGGLDPFSGSPDAVKAQNNQAGVGDFNLSIHNADYAVDMGNYQAGVYRQAGASAAKNGLMSGIGSIIGGIGSAYMLGGFGGGSSFGTVQGAAAGNPALVGMQNVVSDPTRYGYGMKVGGV